MDWSTPKQVGSTYWRGITYGDGKFVMVGNSGYITSSADGVNWSTPKQVGTTYWNAVNYNNGISITVGNEGYIATSTDGINWTTPERIKDESGKVVTAILNGICAMP